MAQIELVLLCMVILVSMAPIVHRSFSEALEGQVAECAAEDVVPVEQAVLQGYLPGSLMHHLDNLIEITKQSVPESNVVICALIYDIELRGVQRSSSRMLV